MHELRVRFAKGVRRRRERQCQLALPLGVALADGTDWL
jgi:hypothetical protein